MRKDWNGKPGRLQKQFSHKLLIARCPLKGNTSAKDVFRGTKAADFFISITLIPPSSVQTAIAVTIIFSCLQPMQSMISSRL